METPLYQTYRDELARTQELSIYHHATNFGASPGWQNGHRQRLHREIPELARYFQACDSTNSGWVNAPLVWSALRALHIPLDTKQLSEAGKRSLRQGKIEWRPFLALLSRVPAARPAGKPQFPKVSLKNQHRNMFPQGAADRGRMEIINAFGGALLLRRPCPATHAPCQRCATRRRAPRCSQASRDGRAPRPR